MRNKTKKHRESNHAYINNVKASSSWRKPKKKSQDRLDIENRLCELSGVNILTVRAVLKHLFGSEKFAIKGVIQQMLDEGKTVDIDGFGTFGHRRNKSKITNDISRPGTMTYTPASSTIDFIPNKRLYWDHFQASMAANMPDEPLPPNMHFSQRITSMPFYKDWLKQMEQSKTTTR